MTLSDRFTCRSLMLVSLYFAQGAPFGFTAVYYLSYLTEHGMPDGQVALLTTLLLLPWSFKALWGPVIDRWVNSSMGRRRPWILGAQFGMAITLGMLITLGTANLYWLGAVLFLHNMFAALQDVAADALAVDVLQPDEFGKLNGWMWVARLVGKSLGAAGSAWIAARYGFSAALVSQASIVLLVLTIPAILLERPGDTYLPSWRPGKSRNSDTPYSAYTPVTFSIVFRRLLNRTILGIVIFGILAAMSESIASVTCKPYYIKQLEWGHIRYSQVLGAVVALEVVGAILGGWLADRYGTKPVIAGSLMIYAGLTLIVGLPGAWHSTSWFAESFLWSSHAVFAVGTVAFLAHAMSTSRGTGCATVFTIMMSSANIGHTLGSALTGWLRSSYGISYENLFVISALSMFAAVVTLVSLRERSSLADGTTFDSKVMHEAA